MQSSLNGQGTHIHNLINVLYLEMEKKNNNNLLNNNYTVVGYNDVMAIFEDSERNGKYY